MPPFFVAKNLAFYHLIDNFTTEKYTNNQHTKHTTVWKTTNE